MLVLGLSISLCLKCILQVILLEGKRVCLVARTVFLLHLCSKLMNNLPLPPPLYRSEPSFFPKKLSPFHVLCLLYATILNAISRKSLDVVCNHKKFQASPVKPKPTEGVPTDWIEHSSADGRRYLLVVADLS